MQRDDPPAPAEHRHAPDGDVVGAPDVDLGPAERAGLHLGPGRHPDAGLDTGAVADLRARLAEVVGRLDGRTLAGMVGAVVVAALAVWLLRPAPAPIEETLPMAAADGSVAAGGSAATEVEAEGPAASTGSSTPTSVVAHAAGAVVSPGVYELAPGARVDDLVRAAGGLAADADEGRINLAAPVPDGARVYVPRRGEEVPEAVGQEVPPPDAGSSGSAGGTSAGGDGAASPVDLNTADEAQLDTLPGVGPATAQAIISHREQSGPFRSVDDLLDVRGIGEAKLEQLRPLVTV